MLHCPVSGNKASPVRLFCTSLTTCPSLNSSVPPPDFLGQMLPPISVSFTLSYTRMDAATPDATSAPPQHFCSHPQGHHSALLISHLLAPKSTIILLDPLMYAGLALRPCLRSFNIILGFIIQSNTGMCSVTKRGKGGGNHVWSNQQSMSHFCFVNSHLRKSSAACCCMEA